MSPPLVRKMKNELKGYKVSGATIHFDPKSPLPKSLVETILRARMDEDG
jgi:hypothetical protein